MALTLSLFMNLYELSHFHVLTFTVLIVPLPPSPLIIKLRESVLPPFSRLLSHRAISHMTDSTDVDTSCHMGDLISVRHKHNQLPHSTREEHGNFCFPVILVLIRAVAAHS